MSTDVIVVGAGAGGLAAARALGALGLCVVVLDRARVAVPTAKGEILQPETVRILDSWKALDTLRSTGARSVSRLAIRDIDGQPLLALDYEALPGAYRQIMCAEYAGLLDALTDGMPSSVEIRRGVRVEDALRDDDGRIGGVRLAGTAGTGTTELRAPLVVAADGMSSALRKAAGVGVSRRPYPHRLLAFDVADADVAAEVSAYRTPRGLVLVYPLPDRRCRLYVQVGSNEFRGEGTGDLSAWCDRLFAEVPAIGPLEAALRASAHRKQLLAVYRLRADRLSVPGLALVGEAAHAVHPMAAQGVNSSLADAEILAARLADVPGLDAPSVDAALRAYHEAQMPRLDHIATVSHNASRMITSVTGLPRILGARMMRKTSANPRLLGLTAGNLSGTNVRPLSLVDRLYQLGLLADRHAHTTTAMSEAR